MMVCIWKLKFPVGAGRIMLWSNDTEPTRVAYHHDALFMEALPLFEAIESNSSPADYQLLQDWLLTCARLIGEAAAMLKDISQNFHVENIEQSNAIIPKLVIVNNVNKNGICILSVVLIPEIKALRTGIISREIVWHRNQTGTGHSIDEADESDKDSIIDHIERD
ncbi:hypothetical protein BDR04DRAFT_1121927 [Suillus decipiens]|nr:hypothetical protein BDR04DRAFT_1121927 [Suillus decipiens]